jgi:hypothetical protein
MRRVPTKAMDYLRCVEAGHMAVLDDLALYRRHIKGQEGWERCDRCGLSFAPDSDAVVDTGDGPASRPAWRSAPYLPRFYGGTPPGGDAA